MAPFKRNLTPIGRGGITKHAGKGSAMAPIPNRGELAQLAKPAGQDLNNYAKATPMAQPMPASAGGLGSGNWAGNGM